MKEAPDCMSKRDAYEVEVPDGVLSILRALMEAGFEAVLVGGCVRDSMMGVRPHDYDIASQATPGEATEALSARGYAVEPTGIAQGGITVVFGRDRVEVTTYRIDGTYLDQRHCAVVFTRSLEEDLRRRDFTINAMALAPVGDGRFRLIDLFGGMADLRDGLIRCVGDPEVRFREDPLRMLRAVRFAARLGFALEPETHTALMSCLPDIDIISAERRTDELLGILAAPHVAGTLLSYAPVVFRLVPELGVLEGLSLPVGRHGNSSASGGVSRPGVEDVWAYTAHVVGGLELEHGSDLALLVAGLLQGCAEHEAVGPGEDVQGAERVEGIVERHLRLRSAVAKRIVLLVRFRRVDTSGARALALLARRVGAWVASDTEVFDVLEELLWLRRAGIRAMWGDDHADRRLEEVEEGLAVVARMRSEGASVRIRDLAIGGKDVIALGVPKGPEVGRALGWLLDLVVSGDVANDREALLEAVRSRMRAADD